MRDSFIFYNSFLEALDELEPEIQLIVYQAIARYSLREEMPALEGTAKAIFSLIKPQIDANNKRYEDGCKGGRPQKQQNKKPVVFEKDKNKKPVVLKNDDFQKPNENENVNVNENENQNENVIDIFCGEEVEKIFQTYQKKCPDLLPLTFERKNREIRQLVADYLEETVRNFSYFETVCEKGNCLKEIAGKKIDLKMLIKNHIGINNGKYLNKESPPKKGLSEDYINDLFK